MRKLMVLLVVAVVGCGGRHECEVQKQCPSETLCISLSGARGECFEWSFSCPSDTVSVDLGREHPLCLPPPSTGSVWECAPAAYLWTCEEVPR